MGGKTVKGQKPSTAPVGGTPAAAAAARARQADGRRRLVDPTTCEREYTAAEIEFMQAMQQYKLQSGRMFPSWSEVLEVLTSLGYQKADPAPPGVVTVDPSEPPAGAGGSGWEAKALSLMSGLPEGSIRDARAGRPLHPIQERLLNESRALYRSLAEVVRPEIIPRWLETPNAELGGVAPLDVLWRGESDRVRDLIFYLESGTPL